MKRSAILFLLILVGAQYCLSQTPSQAETHFKQLQGLAGSWKLSNPTNPGKVAFRISFKSISHDSALVETFGDPAGPVTETVYHLDGEYLMATHYCAQGNQPRLRLQKDSTATALHFSFLDITNLKHASDSHLVDLRFTLLADGRMKREETYSSDGQYNVSTLVLERAN